MDATHEGEINSGMRDAMWRGHGGWEMALVPALFGLGGWYLDGALGIRPVLTVILVLVGLAGSVANQYFQYEHRMRLAGEARRAARSSREGAGR